MVKTPKGYLRKPQKEGFLSPMAANSVIAAGAAHLGAERMEAIQQEAELFRAPAETEPLREEKAGRLHLTLFREAPEQAEAILGDAGRATADAMMETQLSRRARAMLSAAPWTVGAWLLGRWATQHAWMFAGSGVFSVLPEMEFQIVGNPLAKAAQGVDVHISIWQERLFERLFQQLVDPRLICREMECEASGAPACQFAFMLREE